MATMTAAEQGALERLLSHAQGDAGPARRVADFLLAWWSPANSGGFDISRAWGLDSAITDDIVTVFGFAARSGMYPDTLGFGSQFEAIERNWRPAIDGTNV